MCRCNHHHHHHHHNHSHTHHFNTHHHNRHHTHHHTHCFNTHPLHPSLSLLFSISSRRCCLTASGRRTTSFLGRRRLPEGARPPRILAPRRNPLLLTSRPVFPPHSHIALALHPPPFTHSHHHTHTHTTHNNSHNSNSLHLDGSDLHSLPAVR